MGRHLEYIPIRVPLKRDRFDLFSVIVGAIRDNGESLQDGDIIVVSSKFVSLSEGRVVELKGIKVSDEAVRLAEKTCLPCEIAELVLREADVVFAGIPGFILTFRQGILVPNAGIDRSNIKPGHAILYPSEPFEKAETLRRRVLLHLNRKVGVVITDSRLMPTRRGTTGITLAVAGFEPVSDERGKRDLFKNVIRVTQRALADDISAGAQLLMGEVDEGIPVVMVRNTGLRMTDGPIKRSDIAIGYDECIFVRGLSSVRPLLAFHA